MTVARLLAAVAVSGACISQARHDSASQARTTMGASAVWQLKIGESRAVAPASGVGVVISFAHPDYKRPYIASDHLTCKSPADAVVQVERRVQRWLEDRFDNPVPPHPRHDVC